MSATVETQPNDGTRQWWLADDDVLQGPFGVAYIVVAIKSGKLNPNTPACLDGTEEWRNLADWPDFRAVVGHTPPPLPSQRVSPTTIPYAEFWDRARAVVLDGGILFLATETVSRLGDFRTNESANSLFQFMAIWMYFAAFESSGFQATLGKKAMGIIVTDLKGKRISFGRASVRYLAKTLSFSIMLIGFFMAAFTERKQALHDILANCLVVYRDPPGGLRAFRKDQPGDERVQSSDASRDRAGQ
jgi:uncharacterized RDD family membrane protein YckC